jgi:hypothetical protein
MWGFLFSYIEGRRLTDILAGCLGVSMIKSAGKKFQELIGLLRPKAIL